MPMPQKIENPLPRDSWKWWGAMEEFCRDDPELLEIETCMFPTVKIDGSRILYVIHVMLLSPIHLCRFRHGKCEQGLDKSRSKWSWVLLNAAFSLQYFRKCRSIRLSHWCRARTAFSFWAKFEESTFEFTLSTILSHARIWLDQESTFIQEQPHNYNTRYRSSSPPTPESDQNNNPDNTIQ